MRKYALILIILTAIGINALYAGTTGKIAGRVKDEKNQPLQYVNVTVWQGTKMITGILTNDKGNYVIINLSPGIYSVRFQLTGRAKFQIDNVQVLVDQTTTVNQVLPKQSVTMPTVKIVAKTPKIQASNTSSTTQVNMSNIGDVAVSNVEGIVALTPGANMSGGELHIRGSRPTEVSWQIDGQTVTDVVSGGNVLTVDPDAISNMSVMAGALPAEVGNANSVINIITKDGDDFYSGKVEYQTDHLIGDGRNGDTFKFALGGPVMPWNTDMRSKFTFFLNGAGDWSDGRLWKYAKGDPNKDFVYEGRQILENEYDGVNPFKSRSDFLGIDLGNRFYNSYNLNLKSKYEIKSGQKISLGIRGDRSVNDFFNYLWRYAPQHNGADETNQMQVVGTYDQVFGTDKTLKIKASYFNKDYSLGPKGISRNSYLMRYIDNNSIPSDYKNLVLNGYYGYTSIDEIADGIYDYGFNDISYWTYRIQGVEDPRPIEGFVAPGSIYGAFASDKTASYNTRADFEWQINQIHQAKTGLEIIQHQIKKFTLTNFLTVYEERRQDYLEHIYNMQNYVDSNPSDTLATVPPELYNVVQVNSEGVATYVPIYYPDDYYKAAYAASGTYDGYKASPIQAAYYLQDKMEWEGMIVNAGLRMDLWYLGTQYRVLQDDGSYKYVKFKPGDRMRMMISPRLGVSHPISEKDVLRFAYNYQNQLPQMQYIFTSKTSDDAATSDATVVVGNPNLEPQITVTYEVGLSHQISEDYVLDMTAYYKNIYNYVSTKLVKKPGEEQIKWYEYISSDYGSARGIDMQLEKSLSDFNSWTIAYSLAWAQGNNSATVIQDEATNLREFPLDWDVRHNMSINYTFRIARNEEFIVPFTDYVLPFSDMSANLTWTASSLSLIHI